MLNLRENLEKRICDCEEGATNTQTYLEFIIEGYKDIGCDLSESKIEYLKSKANNEELNDVLEEIEWLLSK